MILIKQEAEVNYLTADQYTFVGSIYSNRMEAEVNLKSN